MKNKKNLSRRTFIQHTALGAAALALTPFDSILAHGAQPSWLTNAAKYRFKMIGHGHIDPVWLWRWTEGVSVVHSTFRSALDRMKENPDMVFVSSSAQFYQWVADNDPGMLAEIRERIKEGRWNVVGGWWIEPDMNIPSGEAMVRQGLYGQLTMQRLLGKRATVAFNPDSFGHTGSLPQIIKKQGMENYVFMRPGPHEKTLPANLFWWEGADGTRVLTYRIQESYNDEADVKKRIDSMLSNADGQPVNSFMAFYGVGDHGGGPTKANLKSIEELKVQEGAPSITYGSVDKYFQEIRSGKISDFQVVKDDLQHHAVGCYTIESAIKKGNRQSEAALVTAEKITAIGSIAWAAVYPKGKFTSAWHKVLFLQFHDSLAGTSLAVHSEDAVEGYGYALNIAHEATCMALQKLEWQIPAEDPGSEYLIVFNPHAREIDAHVSYELGFGGISSVVSVTDDTGKELPHQWTLGETSGLGRRRILFKANLPPMGYRQVRIRKGDDLPIGKPATAEGHVLENEYYKIRISNKGTVGILDKETGKEVFENGETGCRAVIVEDPSDTWSHDMVAFDKETGAFGNANIKVIEKGPLKATIRVVSTYGDSKLTIDWSLYAGSRNIEANVTLDWHERLKMLKFSFPVNAESPEATYEIPYGFIVRETAGAEDPGQRWIDVTGKQDGSTYGLTVINDAKYGYSVKGNDMRVSVARAAVYAHHEPFKLNPDDEYMWMDQKVQAFRMMLVPHRNTWKENNIPGISEEFLSVPVVIYQGIHSGSMPKSGSFLSVDKPNVIVSSVKKSEFGDDLIIRCVEMHGTETGATLQFPADNFKWSGNFGKNEIKTLRYNRKKRTVKEVNLLEE
jgi:alpha-mannosidase